MHVETSLRLLALAMQLSKLVKTLVLRATNVPTRTENTMAMASARMPQMTPALACPEFVAPLVLPRGEGDDAQDSRDKAPQQTQGEKDERQGSHEAGHAEHQGGHPRPFPGR